MEKIQQLISKKNLEPKEIDRYNKKESERCDFDGAIALFKKQISDSEQTTTSLKKVIKNHKEQGYLQLIVTELLNEQKTKETETVINDLRKETIKLREIIIEQNTEIRGIKKNQAVKNTSAVWSLDSSKLMLKNNRFLLVTVKEDGNMYIVNNEEFNVSGMGRNYKEARKDFVSFLIHDYFSLKNTPSSEMSNNAKYLFSRYKETVKEK